MIEMTDEGQANGHWIKNTYWYQLRPKVWHSCQFRKWWLRFRFMSSIIPWKILSYGRYRAAKVQFWTEVWTLNQVLLGGWILKTCYGYSIYDLYITYPFIATRTFDIESLYHSTYFLNISFNTVFHHLKPKNSFLYLLHFSYIRVKDQHSQTCRVEH